MNVVEVQEQISPAASERVANSLSAVAFWCVALRALDHQRDRLHHVHGAADVDAARAFATAWLDTAMGDRSRFYQATPKQMLGMMSVVVQLQERAEQIPPFATRPGEDDKAGQERRRREARIIFMSRIALGWMEDSRAFMREGDSYTPAPPKETTPHIIIVNDALFFQADYGPPEQPHVNDDRYDTCRYTAEQRANLQIEAADALQMNSVFLRGQVELQAA
jgi:hypothetical protein